METIRILQNIYEELYVARKPLANFLEERLPALSSQWKKECIENVLNEKVNKNFFELDIYYLLQILLDEQNWHNLKNLFPKDECYFEEENKILYKKVRQIRNEVMHPSLSSYTYADFLEQEKTINSFVNVFSQEKNLPQLILELHQAEKTKLINIIEKNVIIPALSCEFLPENIIKSIKNTRTRLNIQNTAQGIISFFNDSLNAERGKEICKVLHKNSLKSFEDIKSEVEKSYYS